MTTETTTGCPFCAVEIEADDRGLCPNDPEMRHWHGTEFDGANRDYPEPTPGVYCAACGGALRLGDDGAEHVDGAMAIGCADIRGDAEIEVVVTESRPALRGRLSYTIEVTPEFRLYEWAERTLRRANLLTADGGAVVNTGGGVLALEVRTHAGIFLLTHLHAAAGSGYGWVATRDDDTDDEDDQYGWDTAAEALTRAVDRYWARILLSHCLACGRNSRMALDYVARDKRPSRCECGEAVDLVPVVEYEAGTRLPVLAPPPRRSRRKRSTFEPGCPHGGYSREPSDCPACATDAGY